MLYWAVVESPETYPHRHLEDADVARLVLGAEPGMARDAEDELYRRLAPRVRLYGLRHLREEQAAQDLSHHVMLLTIEKLRAKQLREPEKIASFVLGTSRMVVRDWWRSAARQKKLADEFARGIEILEEFNSPEIETAQLTECLQRLLERERTILVMTFYGEKSTQEVAMQLGLSSENVRVIRHRALGRTRQCMTGGRGTS
jgi:RNA polymerase sigma-70 factor, ECF subfamily